jgi:hypothetical protein
MEQRLAANRVTATMKLFACIWSGLFLYITASALIYPAPRAGLQAVKQVQQDAGVLSNLAQFSY